MDIPQTQIVSLGDFSLPIGAEAVRLLYEFESGSKATLTTMGETDTYELTPPSGEIEVKLGWHRKWVLSMPDMDTKVTVLPIASP